MNAPATITVTEIDSLLPQTQCGKCGQPGCRPYARAIIEGEAINRCPPGGERTVRALAALLDRPVIPLEAEAETPKAAVIREAECIGCTKCIQACPVDAILGAAQQMHTVIEAECTGCELCVAPCPVDCIDIIPHPGFQAMQGEQQRTQWLERRAALGRARFEKRNERLERLREEKEARRRARMSARRESQKQSEARAPSQAAPASSKRLRAQQAALGASIRKCEKRLAADPQDTEAQRSLEQARQQLTELTAQTAHAAPPRDAPRETSQNARRIAHSAARQTLARAERQLVHARRQGDPAAIERAKVQRDKAQHTLDQTRQALSQTDD